MAESQSGTVAGTKVTWAASGGDKLLTLTSLANNAAREGAKSETLLELAFNNVMPVYLSFRFKSAVALAPTDGAEIEVYIGESDNATPGTNNPANLTGADAALANPDELKYQAIRAGVLRLSNARGTNVQEQMFLPYIPSRPYIIPLVVNKSGQALHGTAGNHALEMIPWFAVTRP